MAKITIYVPDDLKRRMDELDAENVSWSPLACQAFEQKLADIITKRGVKKMDDVITRLRASKQASASDDYKAGYEAGVKWAKGRAEAVELERLDSLVNSTQFDWDEFVDESPNRSAYSACERLVSIIIPEHDGDRRATADFWDQISDATYVKPAFVHGFGEGAMSVWEEVKDQL
jgi:predicted transcriptional regulator